MLAELLPKPLLASPPSHTPICLQSSLEALATPALLLFLHLLPTAAALRLLGAQGALELRPLSLRTLQGGLVPGLLLGLQVSAGCRAVAGCVGEVLCVTGVWRRKRGMTRMPSLLRASSGMAAWVAAPISQAALCHSGPHPAACMPITLWAARRTFPLPSSLTALPHLCNAPLPARP